jgi:hypothetical protein
MMNTLVRPAKVIVNELHGVWRYFSNHIVQDVPEAIELCEFDCRKAECTAQEWASCERRLKRAAGELMPVRRDSAS